MDLLNKTKNSYLVNAAFIFSIIIVCFNLVSILFPALIVRITSGSVDAPVSPFEIGPWAFPLLFANVAILAIALLYSRGKLPTLVKNTINFILKFETSRRITLVAFLVILGIYIGLSAGELFQVEQWLDFHVTVKPQVTNWSFDDPPGPKYRFLENFFLHLSYIAFQNMRVIPFVASILLVILTYFFTKEITEKRFAGLVAMVLVLQSHIFLTYDTTATYTNFWILLYLFSVYLILKKWQFSAFSYIISPVTKPLTGFFLPMTFYFIFRSDLPKHEKIKVGFSYVVVAAILIIIVMMFELNLPDNYFTSRFWAGFSAIAYQLRFDFLLLIFILPVVVGLFKASKNGILHADSIMIFIAVSLLMHPMLAGLGPNIHPYRYIPLIVFFAIAVGILLSNKIRKVEG